MEAPAASPMQRRSRVKRIEKPAVMPLIKRIIEK
jgi:hypothetical protein